ncbi:MAG TPA: DUF5709 domain-containing protein [Mycobacteriales bacterium]|nr:DUF5709 domain-containing protein [Mycobacteriales bacterium]
MPEEHSQSVRLGEAVQLDPAETLDSDDPNDEPLDSGYIPPDKPADAVRRGATAQDQVDGGSLEERLDEEEPADAPTDPNRTGRLVAEDEGVRESDSSQSVARDVEIDGGAASAEEAAVHEADEP